MDTRMSVTKNDIKKNFRYKGSKTTGLKPM